MKHLSPILPAAATGTSFPSSQCPLSRLLGPFSSAAAVAAAAAAVVAAAMEEKEEEKEQIYPLVILV